MAVFLLSLTADKILVNNIKYLMYARKKNDNSILIGFLYQYQKIIKMVIRP